MNKLRSIIRRSPLVQSFYYGLRLDEMEHKLSDSWDKEISDALNLFLSEEEKKDETKIRLIKEDINRCYHQIKTSPTEYFMFDLRYKDYKERSTYLSDKVILSELTKKGQRYLHDTELHDKYAFYCLTKEWFNRDVIEVTSEDDYDKYMEMVLSNHEVIIKPNSSACGSGIFALDVNTEDEATQLFKKLVSGRGKWVIEKRVVQSKAMARWNESSVNTVRVVTYKNKKGTYFDTHPFFRTGRAGCVVDNAGVGGIYALLDIQTGEIITDGMSEQHITYVVHPDSKQTFKGEKIPDFQELKLLAITIHNERLPQHIMIGWDFAHTDKGWVLIEGNWGTCVCQQSQLRRGLKQEFLDNIKG